MSVGKIPMTFDMVKDIVAAGEITKLYRSEAGLSQYHKFKSEMKAKGINVTTNLLINKLFWVPKSTPQTLPPDYVIDNLVHYTDARPFANKNDIIVTPNSFPYYLTDNLSHLCVWIKSPMLPDPKSDIGDISVHDKHLIEEYINETFVKWLGISRENIVWFKNWASLQSVKSIPHVHVIVKDLSKEQYDKVVNTPGVPLNYTVLESKLSKL
ncbi:unnamed protein product [Ambrosiozyma monospora]|uniref:Unnamed protein product n=1 Tax=Ambrosiozyma monospora TaxID=43982 RepID=A0A9W7DEQ8_AMBMO|nr:unnamed protein product [Ambrosiozyma monospora]